MRITPALLLLLSIVGCNRGPAIHVTAAPDQVPPGWTIAESSDRKVKLAVPPGWRLGVDKMGGIDLQGLDASGDHESLRALQQMGAEFQRQADEQEREQLENLAAKGILVHVIAEGIRPIPGEARTRFYVLKQTKSGPLTLEGAAEIERAHYAHKPSYQVVKLPIGEAIRCEMSDSLRDGGTLNQISVVVVDGKDMYSLRFVTQEAPQTIQSIADQVAQSLRIQPSR